MKMASGGHHDLAARRHGQDPKKGTQTLGPEAALGGREPMPGRGQRYIGKKLSNADKLALVKLSAKLSISKNWNFEIIEKLSISENASNLVR